MLLGLYFHLLALCVFVHIPPPFQPRARGPLPPSLPFALLPTLVRESSSNSSFPSTITFLPVGFCCLSLSCARARHPPSRSLPLNPFLALRLCLISPFSHRSSSTPAYPASPSYHVPHSVVPTSSLAVLLPDVCFSSLPRRPPWLATGASDGPDPIPEL